MGLLGAVLTWNYGTLPACRLLTGVEAVVGVPLVVCLLDAGAVESVAPWDQYAARKRCACPGDLNRFEHLQQRLYGMK